MGREKYGERKEQLTIQSTPHQVSNMVAAVLWHGHMYHCNGTASLVFIGDVTADRSSRMNSEVFKAILSAHIQPNATKLIGHNFTDG